MKNHNVYVYILARNEAGNMKACLDSLINQTLSPKKILVIDDGSTDETASISREYDGVKVLTLSSHPYSYTENIELAWKLSTVANHAFPVPPSMDYFMALAPDTILPLDYTEKLVELMEANPRLVIAGGTVQGEPCLRTHVRGSGRLYKTWFWNKYVSRHPMNYMWESYPLYKAAALGLETRSFPELLMKPMRPTKKNKSMYGYAMRQFGYFPPFAIMKCLMAMFTSRETGMRMLYAYLTSPFKPTDATISNFVKHHQIGVILKPKGSLKTWLAKL